MSRAIDTAQPLAGFRPDWAIVIFASQETAETLLSTIIAAAKAARYFSVIDVVVNGNSTLVTLIVDHIKRYAFWESTVVRIWWIELADKAHAWNSYVHQIWPGGKLTFFIDGYARVCPDALELLEISLSSSLYSLAGSGVPTSGRTAAALRAQMLQQGGIHGNLYVLKEYTMNELRRKNFNLPLGVYRTDPTLGAVLAFGLDPSKHHWDSRKYIYIHPYATWTVDDKIWWKYSNIASQIKRKLRQAQGILEVHAVRNFLAREKRPPEQLPRTVEELVFEWMRLRSREAMRLLFTRPLTWLAIQRLRKPKDWTVAIKPPKLLAVTSNRALKEKGLEA